MHRAYKDFNDSVHMFRHRLACSDLPGLLIIEGALAALQQIGSRLMPLSAHIGSAYAAVNFAGCVECVYIAQNQHEA